VSSRFPSAEILRRLGVPDPHVYDVRGGQNLVPTMTVLDMSRSLATEPFELRGIAGRNIAAGGAGLVSVGHLRSRSPGGLVVEFLQVATSGATQAVRMRVSATPGAFTLGGSNTGIATIGGAPPQAVSQWGWSTAAASPGLYSILADAATLLVNNVQLGGRWFVPSGATLEVGTEDLNASLIFAWQWRELPEIQT